MKMEDNEDLKQMSEMWDKDKLKKKEEIEKLNSQIEDVQNKLAEKDDLINIAKQETEDEKENIDSKPKNMTTE